MGSQRTEEGTCHNSQIEMPGWRHIQVVICLDTSYLANTRVTEGNLMTCDIQEMNLVDLLSPLAPKHYGSKKWKILHFCINVLSERISDFFIIHSNHHI